jgi:hypothetical protein
MKNGEKKEAFLHWFSSENSPDTVLPDCRPGSFPLRKQALCFYSDCLGTAKFIKAEMICSITGIQSPKRKASSRGIAWPIS